MDLSQASRVEGKCLIPYYLIALKFLYLFCFVALPVLTPCSVLHSHPWQSLGTDRLLRINLELTAGKAQAVPSVLSHPS